MLYLLTYPFCILPISLVQNALLLQYAFSGFLLMYHNIFCSGMSTAHAIFISTMSLYFVFWSDLYSDHLIAGNITFRSSQLSSFALGVSISLICCSVSYDIITDSFCFFYLVINEHTLFGNLKPSDFSNEPYQVHNCNTFHCIQLVSSVCGFNNLIM